MADCYRVETTRLIDVHTVYYCDSTQCVCVQDALSVLSLAKVGNKHIIALVRVEYGWTLHSWAVFLLAFGS